MGNSPEFEKALQSFTKAPELCPDLDVIATCAEQTLEFIKFWIQIQSKNQAVVIVANGIQKQSDPYLTAIDQSVKTAEQGCTFTSDAIEFCNILLDPDTASEEIAEYSSEMSYTAGRAIQAATEALNLFRDIRTALFQIIMETDKATVGTGSQGSAFERWYPSLVARSSRSKSLDSVADPEKALESLQNLTLNMDQFTEWWVEMETTLKVIVNLAEVGAGRLRIKQSKKCWEKVQVDYLNFKRKIYAICDQTQAIQASA